MQQIIDLFDKYIDWTLVILIITSSYFAQKFFGLCDILPKLKMAIKVLIWSTIITVLYWLLLVNTGVFKKEEVPVYFISYTVATSFWECLIQPVKEWIKKVSGSKELPQ